MVCEQLFYRCDLFTKEAANVGDLIQGAEADGDGIASFCEFHRALYGSSDGVSGFDRAVEVRADLGFQLVWSEGAVRVRELGDEAGGVRGDEAEHGMVVLILHDAHDEVDFLVREVSADCVDEGFDAIRVVGAIDDEKRFPRENLETSRPGSLGETGTDRVLRDAPAAADQAVDDVEHSHRVFHLVVSEQLDTEMPASTIVEDLPVDRPRAGGEGRRIRDDEARCCRGRCTVVSCRFRVGVITV